LRQTQWEGRELDEVELVDCKLAGARGKAQLVALAVERPDLSSGGDGSQIASASDVYRLLGTLAPERAGASE